MQLDQLDGDTNPLHNPCAYTRDMAFYDLVSWCTEYKGTSGIYWRKQCIAIFKAMLQIRQGLVELL